MKKRKKMWRWFTWVIVALLLILVITNGSLLLYALAQGAGQMKIIWTAKPVSHFLEDAGFPDSLKTKLRLIDEARRYAIDSLGLKDTDNYRTLYDQKGEEVMWVVTACEPFRLEPKLWHFPIVGTVPYKGYFNKEDAIALARELEAQGYDVSVRNPGGWSTLGWFTDPILSGMLERSEGDLASLIIHEMSHATIFVKDSVDFNENLASFIGDRGAEYFLISKYGRNSSQYLQYIQEDHDYVALVGHMLCGAKYLDSLYATVSDKTLDEKRRAKEEAIRSIVVASDTLTLFSSTKPSARFRKSMPNNAYFMTYIHYQSGQEELRREWQQSFAGDLRAYIRHLSGRYPYL